MFYDQSKHINSRYHFIKEYIIENKVQLKFSKSCDQDELLNEFDWFRIKVWVDVIDNESISFYTFVTLIIVGTISNN